MAYQTIHLKKVEIYIFHVENINYLLVIDYYFKYSEVIKLTSMSSVAVIQALTEIFCRFGIPQTIVSHNGPQFASEEFKSLLRDFALKYISRMLTTLKAMNK